MTRWRKPVVAAAGPKIDTDRFVQTEPFLELGPNEVFVAPTIEELADGKTGTIVDTATGVERPA